MKKFFKFKSFVHFFSLHALGYKSGRCPEGNALWSYSNMSADLIGTLIKIEVFLQSAAPLNCGAVLYIGCLFELAVL